MTPGTAPPLRGSTIIRAIKAAGIEFVLSVPDITTSEGLLRPISRDPELRLIRVCKEDEAIGIAAGLWATGKRSLILIQNTGLLDSINAIRAVAVEYAQPICMMVGLLTKEADRKPQDSRVFGVRIVPPILDAMGLRYHVIEFDPDVDAVTPRLNLAYRESQPIAFLIGQSPTP